MRLTTRTCGGMGKDLYNTAGEKIVREWIGGRGYVRRREGEGRERRLMMGKCTWFIRLQER